MPLREDILAAIAGENPSGIDLRYDTKLLIFDKIKEARRQDDELEQGAWQSERKTANWAMVIKLAQDALATVSKDLQLAAYLTEALLQTDGFSGLNVGLDLTYSLLTEFWDSIYPTIEDGDRELRARPLAWLTITLGHPIRCAPIVSAGYSEIAYKESRMVGYEDQVKTEKERKARNEMIQRGKLAPEMFDKAFAETPKSSYLQAEKEIDSCLEVIGKLDKFCDEKFEQDAPGFTKIKTALTEVRHTVHLLLEKKREKDPDAVKETLAEVPAATKEDGVVPDLLPSSVSAMAVTIDAEPADMRQAVQLIVMAASFMRKRDPYNPAPYLLLRGLRWGELRSAERLVDSALLEAPPTELRQQIKRLAIAKRWSELLEAGEKALALPGSRAWLDLQRLSVAACTALGNEYQPIATAIRSALRALLNDLPELIDATLLDDTPAANQETREWLKSLGDSATTGAPTVEGEAQMESCIHRNGAPSWLARAVDPFTLAKEALSAGQEEKAFAIMRVEVARQRSGRRRFRRTMETIELAIAAGRDSIAQPLLEDIAAAIEAHKLDAWEDSEEIAGDLSKLMRYSKKIQAIPADKQKLFERICRLDPVQALGMG